MHLANPGQSGIGVDFDVGIDIGPQDVDAGDPDLLSGGEGAAGCGH